MEQLLLLGITFSLGAILAWRGRLPSAAPAGLNAYVINVALPAVVLLHIHRLHISTSLLAPVLAPWIIFGLASAMFAALGPRLGLSRGTVGCLILTAGLGNTSFVGLPLIEAFYGRDAVAIGVLLDQPGSFLVLSTLGLLTAARFSGGDHAPRAIARRVFRFPPFVAMLVAVALMPVEYPQIVSAMLERLGDTLAPVALVSAGMQLRFSHIRDARRPLALGLAWKMALAPAIVFGLLAIAGIDRHVLQVTVFESAMPPMITGAIVAMDHELDPPLAAAMLGVGIPLSFATLPLWWWLMS